MTHPKASLLIEQIDELIDLKIQLKECKEDPRYNNSRAFTDFVVQGEELLVRHHQAMKDTLKEILG